MTNAAYQVRRATIDDLPEMIVLWNSMHIPTVGLERRLTEFQLVQSEHGEILGAIGLEVIDRQGRIYNEAYHNFALADTLRQYLWARVQSLAENQGLARLWSNESAPFWKQGALHPADDNVLKKLPPAWAQLPGPWHTLRLRDEDALRTALEADFTRLREVEGESTERTRGNARLLSTLLLLFAIGLFAAAVVFFFRHLPQLRGH